MINRTNTNAFVFFIFITLLFASCSKLQKVDDVCEKMDDIVFMEYCYNHFDINKDGKVSMSEASAVSEIDIHKKGVHSLNGIEYFSSLTQLTCSNNKLTSLDISHNKGLTQLTCSNNKLTSLDISHNKDLIQLTCSNNILTTLDVSNNSELIILGCGGNELTSLDISGTGLFLRPATVDGISYYTREVLLFIIHSPEDMDMTVFVNDEQYAIIIEHNWPGVTLQKK